MKIVIANSSTDPIYEQICKQIKNSIIMGEMAPGEMLPSIRKLAAELQISVITSKRAYEELEKEGFIETVGGKGSFVSGENRELLREKRLKMIEDRLAEIIEESRVLGISREELQEMLQYLLEEV